jgi:protein-S-isoprenylcysteine O-methyltransferase Ste14
LTFFSITSNAAGNGWTRFQRGEALAAVCSLSGIALRLYSITSFGRLFTFEVGIGQNHRLVDTGPYRLLLRPPYTGLFMSMKGALYYLGVHSPYTITTFAVTYSAAIVVRVMLEERVLHEEFGEDFLRFKNGRSPLVPFVF